MSESVTGVEHSVADLTSDTRSLSSSLWQNAVVIPNTGEAGLGSTAGAKEPEVECWAVGECIVVGGFWSDLWVAGSSYAAVQSAGVWGPATEIPGLSSLNHGQAISPRVACTSSGDCTIAGPYEDADGNNQVFVATRAVTGSWVDAAPLAGFADFANTSQSAVSAVSCSAAGECAVVGWNLMPFAGYVATQSEGVWSPAIRLPGIDEMLATSHVQVTNVACWSPGSCTAIGTYMAGSPSRAQGFVLDLVDGVWADVADVPALKDLNRSSVSFEALSCGGGGSCSAAGRFWNGSGFVPFVVDRTPDGWGDASQLTGVPVSPSVLDVQKMSCSAPGLCTLVVAAQPTTFIADRRGYIAERSATGWDVAKQWDWIDGSGPTIERVWDVSCSASGECALAGQFRSDDAPFLRAYVLAQTDGEWGLAQPVPGLEAFPTSEDNPFMNNTDARAVSCVSGWCVGVGINIFDRSIFSVAQAAPEPAPTPEPPPPPPAPVPTTPTVPPAPAPTPTVPPAPSPTPTPTPTPGGQLPQVSPGVVQVVTQCPSDSKTSANGLCDDAPVQVSVVNQDRDLVLKGSDFDLSIAGDCVEDCRITQSAEGRQVLELERNGRARVQGSGFEAGSPVYVWLFSEPKLLGTLTVARDGTFTGSVPIGTIDVGEHTLQVSGQSADGRTRALSLGVVVSAPDRYIPLMPERIMDTRAGHGVLQPGEVLQVPVDAVPVDAEAVALNVTVANAEGDGFFTVWPCGGSAPNASSGNFVGITTIAGKVVSGIGEDHSVCVSVGQSAAHVLVDLKGYFPFGSSYEAFSPRRMFDSRESHGVIAADDMVRVSLGDLADDVTAAVVNVTIANATGDGFFTVWDCATQVPPTSNGNFVGISTVANKVVTATGADNEICVRVGQASAHVIVDLLGALHADSHYEVMGDDLADVLGGGRAYEPDRVVDTREDGELVQPGETLRVELDGVPTGARAVKMNVTVANAQGDGFVTVWPCGGERPDTSNGNFVGITTIANKVISGIGENHSICIELGQSPAEIIVDLFGFVPAPVR